jgi:hypothetical protein
MSLRRLALLKHILYAALLLVFLLSATEVGLRIAVLRGALPPGIVPTDELTVPCWQCHHQLKPLASLAGENPDTGRPVEISTNSFGLRGPEIAVPKPTGVYRIVCLGDEHVLAPGTELALTFCERLRTILQPRTSFTVEVVNAGVPGYCPLLSYLQVKHSLLALQPDLMVLNFDMSDVADDQNYRRNTQINDAGVPISCPNSELEPHMASTAQLLDEQFLTVKWGKTLLEKLPIRASGESNDIYAPRGRYAWLADNPPDWDLYTEQALSPIEKLRETCDQSFVGFVVATAPAPWQVSSQASSGPGVREKTGIGKGAVLTNRRPFDVVAGYLEKRAIPFCDASPAFAAADQPERLFLKNAAELSPDGHALYAEQLAAFLVRSVPGIWNRGANESESTPLPPRMATRDSDGLGL